MPARTGTDPGGSQRPHRNSAPRHVPHRVSHAAVGGPGEGRRRGGCHRLVQRRRIGDSAARHALGRLGHRRRIIGRKARGRNLKRRRPRRRSHDRAITRFPWRDTTPDGADVVIVPGRRGLSEPALGSLSRGGISSPSGYASGVIPSVPLNLILVKGVHVLGLPVPGRAARSNSPRNEEDYARCSSAARCLLTSARSTAHRKKSSAASRHVAERARAIGKVLDRPHREPFVRAPKLISPVLNLY